MAYKGVSVEVPLGQNGLSGSRNTLLATYSHLIKANNITYEEGLISKEGGAAKYNAAVISGAPSIHGGHDWFFDGVSQRMIVVLSDGTIKKDSGTGTFPVTLRSGLSVTTGYARFVEGGKEAAALNRKLFIFNGAFAPQVLSGDDATTTDIATPPADWTAAKPKFGVLHQFRIFAGGNTNDPHRLYYSTITNHEDFTGAGSGTLSIGPGDGGILVGAVSFKGLLIAFKSPRGIYLIDTSDPASANWSIKKHNGEIGCLGVNSYTLIDDDILFLDQTGQVQLLSAVQEFGSLGQRNLSDISQIRFFVEREIDFSLDKDKVRTVYYSAKREVHVACRSKVATTVNDRRFVVDFGQGNPKFRLSDRDVPISLWINQSSGKNRLFMGDNAGFVWKLDESARSKDGAAYTGELHTPPLDLREADPSLAVKRKNGNFLELLAQATGNFDLTVKVLWDGVLTQTILFNLGSQGSPINTFTLGTDALGSELPINKRKRLVGSGKRIQLQLSNAGLNENFIIERMFIHFNVSDEREL